MTNHAMSFSVSLATQAEVTNFTQKRHPLLMKYCQGVKYFLKERWYEQFPLIILNCFHVVLPLAHPTPRINTLRRRIVEWILTD